MKIEVALQAGFCIGIDRAVKRVYEEVEKNTDKKIVTLGPIAHNNDVVDTLRHKGVHVIERIEEGKDKTVIIRAHGVGEQVYNDAALNRVNLIDSTCPYVKRVHKIVNEHYKNGYQVIVVGKSSHPEVVGVLGWCDNTGICVNEIEKAYVIKGFEKICVVAQTTITKELWDGVVGIINDQNDNVVAMNTICKATSERQEAAAELAKRVDLMIVVGGFHSSNTKKLVEICKKYCPNTVHFENSENIVVTDYKKYGIIGITAGASTPVGIIEKIIFKINEGEVQVNG